MNETNPDLYQWKRILGEEFSNLNGIEKAIRVALILIILYTVISVLTYSNETEFIWVSGLTGNHVQFTLDNEYVDIIRKAVHNNELTQREIETLKSNVSREHAQIAYSVLRKDWYQSQGLEGIQTTIASNVQAEEFVNDIYGYAWQYYQSHQYQEVMMTEENNNTNNDNITTPKLNNKFIQNIKGKEFILYAGLLDYAHQKGLQKLEVKLIQIPNDDNNNNAICIAKVTSSNGDVYVDVGDASPNNVNHKIAPHIIRMASTRAKARCLRDFCNVGMVCVEELGDDAIQDDNNGFKQYQNNYSNNNVNGNGNGNSNGNHSTHRFKNGSANMSEAQRRAIHNLAKRRKLTDDELHQMIEDEFNTTLDNLTIQTASNLIQTLQNQN